MTTENDTIGNRVVISEIMQIFLHIRINIPQNKFHKNPCQTTIIACRKQTQAQHRDKWRPL